MSGVSVFAFLVLCAVLSVLLSFLKTTDPAMAAALAAASAAVMCIFLLDALAELQNDIFGILAPFARTGTGVLIKGVFISFATETAASLCRDNGQSALGVKAEFAGRVAMVSLALPLVKELLLLLEEL